MSARKKKKTKEIPERMHVCAGCGDAYACTSEEKKCPSRNDKDELLCPECFFEFYGGCG